MRAHAKILISLIVVAATATMSSCATESTVKATKPAGEVQASATVEGTITFIEPDGTLIVRDQAGGSSIVYLRQGAKITQAGQKMAPEDLKTGDVISAKVDSMKSAIEIQVIRK